MTAPLAGVRVVEVASHVFVPISGAVLAEWGADVIKIEHPETGDPYRGLVTAGLHKLHQGVDSAFQGANRGKRSVAIDLKHPDGRALLSRLVSECDVFVTNLRADTRRRLRLDVDDIRGDNPNVIYVRGTAFGPKGPDAGRGGYDAGAYWARTGMGHLFTGPDAAWPAGSRPAFGDVVGGLTIAGAISTALYRRATSGETSVVDVSLVASGLWQIQMDVVHAALEGPAERPRPANRYDFPNPLMLPYRTSDGRFVSLQMLSPERYWPDLCTAIGQPEKATDPRFASIDARRENRAECIEWLEETFAERTFDEWRKVLADFEGEWVPVQSPHDALSDPQVVANRYIATVDVSGVRIPMVTAPVQFDEQESTPTRAPEHGEHTETVLLDLGMSWEEIGELKSRRAIL
jgi:crotonobetainyl-CoA:carnitine CoA-transferase CaiB-like acyl-CoA transferase